MKECITKINLLQKGLELFTCKGFNHTGIQEILDGTGVPKGSFYHHFKSKEDFGLQVLEFYAKESEAAMKQMLGDPNRKPLEKLRDFFEMGKEKFEIQQCKGGCLIGNLSQELADNNPKFQEILANKMEAMQHYVTVCLTEAQKEGDIPNHYQPAEMADFLLNAFQGAIMRAKVEGHVGPLDTHIRLVFEGLLHPGTVAT